MEKALQHYDESGVSPSSVSERDDGRVTATLGDGERVPPKNPLVADMAMRLHHRVAPLSPRQVYEYVHAPHVNHHDALGVPFASCANVRARPADGGDALDPRFHAVSVAHIAPNLLDYAKSLPSAAVYTLGHRMETYSFDTITRARLAVAVDLRHRLANVDDVLRCISRAIDAIVLREGVLCSDVVPPLAVETVPAPDGRARLPTSEWQPLLHRLESMTPGATALRVYLDNRRAVATVTVVHCHWARVDECAISHCADAGCELRYVPEAPCGGSLELSLAWESDWPWWVGRNVERVETRVPPMLVLAKRERSPSPPRFEPPNQKIQDMLQRWHKSAKAVAAPRLHAIVQLPRNDVVVASDGMVAERVCADDADAWQVFKERFGDKYANDTATRSGDAAVGLYVVRVAGERAAAFDVVMYDCTFADGEKGAAVMIDSFAVLSAFDSTGVGGRVFREICLALGARRATRYVVFAQCVKSGHARHFWYDKLDDSSEARALVLQAVRIDPHLAPLQSETVCTARARQYRVRE